MSFNSSSLIQGPFPPECEVKPPIINALLFFKNCPTLRAVQESCIKLLAFERFKRTAKYDASVSTWIFEDSDFKYDNLFSSKSFDGEDDLMKEVDLIAATDIDGYGKSPLWNVHILKNNGPGLSAVLIRIHHVIGDGIAIVGVMGKLFETISGGALKLEIPGSTVRRKSFSLSLLWDFFTSVLGVLGLAVSSYDSDIAISPLNKSRTKMTSSRRTIIFPTLQLDFVKALKNKANVTVNDVLLSIVSGAIRRYCLSRHDPLFSSSHKLQCRALLPVAFPRSRFN
jgi:NRPS condensation-like uncharacterized protein